MIDASIHNAKLLGWALLFSVVNGGFAGGLIAALGADSNFHWYEGLLGGAVFGPMLTLIFETPLRSVVRAIIQIPYAGWAIVLPFALLRFIMSWPAVMVANSVMGSRTAAPAPAPTPLPQPRLPDDNGCRMCDGRAALGGGNGKCAMCHGTGKQGKLMDAMAASLSNSSQDCNRCGGSGRCTACAGKGYRG